jgi:hypothetical protein
VCVRCVCVFVCKVGGGWQVGYTHVCVEGGAVCAMIFLHLSSVRLVAAEVHGVDFGLEASTVLPLIPPPGGGGGVATHGQAGSASV